MLALFSAPRKVLINLKFLDTLPEREFISGLGESLHNNWRQKIYQYI